MLSSSKNAACRVGVLMRPVKSAEQLNLTDEAAFCKVHFDEISWHCVRAPYVLAVKPWVSRDAVSGTPRYV